MTIHTIYWLYLLVDDSCQKGSLLRFEVLLRRSSMRLDMMILISIVTLLFWKFLSFRVLTSFEGLKLDWELFYLLILAVRSILSQRIVELCCRCSMQWDLLMVLCFAFTRSLLLSYGWASGRLLGISVDVRGTFLRYRVLDLLVVVERSLSNWGSIMFA